MEQRTYLESFFCYVLLALIVLYFSQGVLIPEGSIGGLLLVLILGISFIYLIKILYKGYGANSLVKAWLFFLIISISYFLLTADYFDSNVFKVMLLNFMPFFPFLYFSKIKVLRRWHLIAFLYIITPIFIFKFSQSLINLRAESMKEDVVDNTIYLFIGLLPFIFLVKNKILSFSLLLLMWLLMIQSTKRVAIICGVIALCLFIIQQIYLSDNKLKIKHYLFSAFSLVLVSYFGYGFYEKNQYLQERMGAMLEGDSSGRDELTKTLLNQWYHSDNIINYVFGYGYNSAKKFTSTVSHNDWVDMLVSYGLIGIIIFFTLFRSIFLQILKKDSTKSKKLIFVLVFSIALITSLTSRWYSANFAYMNMILLPYILATRNKEI